MAEIVKISGLPLLATAPATTVEFAINDGGTTKKLTLDNLMTRVGSLAALTGGITNTSIVAAINYVYGLDASISSKGFVTTGTQSIAGNKTLTGQLILDGNHLAFKSSIAPNYVVLASGAAASSFYVYLPTALPGSTSFMTITSGGQIGTTTSVVTSVATGAGLTGGPITSTGTIALAASGVVSGTYGSTVTIPQITVDTYGRITGVATAIIPNASTVATGLLTSTNWNTFNGKLDTPTLNSESVVSWNGSGLTETTDFEATTNQLSNRVVKVPNSWNKGSEINDKIQTVTANTTLDGSERLTLIDPTPASNIQINFPPSATIDVGTTYYFKIVNNDATSVKLLVTGSDYIDQIGVQEVSLNVSYGYAAVIYAEANHFETLYIK